MRRLADAALVLALATALTACADERAALPYYGDAQLTPVWLAPAAADRIHRVGDFNLSDQTGHVFGADSLAGRVYVASFFFATCRDICPTTVRRLQAVADTFAAEDRTMIVSFSVTPERDSVPALAAYAAMHGIEARRWRLLTGDAPTMRRMAESYLIGLGRGSDYGVEGVAHTEMVVLVDQRRHIRGVYDATLALEVGQLVKDIRLLLAQQDEGRTPVDDPMGEIYSSLLDSRLNSTAAEIP